MERIYETTIIVNAGQARADKDGTLAAVRGLYETEGAEWIELSDENLGERRLAYPINGEATGLYLEGYFTAPADAISRIERRVELNELVLRQLIISRDVKGHEKMKDYRAKRAERMAEAAAAAAADDGED
ncbi:MAG: 30S ribosomal protein S6 [Planctomycetota bacterium]|jgi:small subunit ribosomal protein S6|nr:30S ribosomal protein S6 [Planctomycetota bacterium]